MSASAERTAQLKPRAPHTVVAIVSLVALYIIVFKLRYPLATSNGPWENVFWVASLGVAIRAALGKLNRGPTDAFLATFLSFNVGVALFVIACVVRGYVLFPELAKTFVPEQILPTLWYWPLYATVLGLAVLVVEHLLAWLSSRLLRRLTVGGFPG